MSSLRRLVSAAPGNESATTTSARRCPATAGMASRGGRYSLGMTTPADLALEYGVPQKRVRDVLRDLFGTLPDGLSRWDLDDNRASLARGRLGDRKVVRKEWGLEVGDVVRRRAIHDAYGGQDQGGISTPRSIPDVLIFTDPKTGARYGYDKFEGLREDGSYWYTGAGQYGPQVFLRGNVAIRDSASKGKILRLLRTNGTLATYVGAFTTGDPTYRLETIPDLAGELRQGIIFNLVPLDADQSLLPTFGGVEAGPTAIVQEWTPPDFADVVVSLDQPPVGERVVSRTEFQLQADFGEWLRDGGDPPQRLSLPVGSAVIEPDLYVPSRAWIVEAKKSIGRNYVRTAIGQVLDYVHVAEKHQILCDPLILLPSAPEADLIELVIGLGIALAYRNGSGFEVVQP